MRFTLLAVEGITFFHFHLGMPHRPERPPEQAVFASQNEMRPVRSEAWTCQNLIRVYKIKCIYTQWM